MLRKPARAAVLSLLVSFSAAAPASTTPLPVPLPAGFPDNLSIRNFGIDLEPACNAVYLNESVTTGYYIPAGAGVELADDLHTTLAAPQAICAFDIGYYSPGAAPVNATVTVYANDPGDAGRGAPIAGPYLVAGLPPGANAFHIEVGSGVVAPHVWLGVAFDDAGTGLLSFGPPSLGSSHDLAWLAPPGISVTYGGQPPANLFLGLHSSPSTPARTATWGNLKAHYR